MRATAFVLLLVLCVCAFAQKDQKAHSTMYVYVHGYRRKDGTYVKGHYRKSPMFPPKHHKRSNPQNPPNPPSPSENNQQGSAYHPAKNELFAQPIHPTSHRRRKPGYVDPLKPTRPLKPLKPLKNKKPSTFGHAHRKKAILKTASI